MFPAMFALYPAQSHPYARLGVHDTNSVFRLGQVKESLLGSDTSSQPLEEAVVSHMNGTRSLLTEDLTSAVADQASINQLSKPNNLIIQAL